MSNTADRTLPWVLVLFYSRAGHTARLARHVARGIERVPGIEARLRTVPALHGSDDATPGMARGDAPVATAALCSRDDLAGCAGLAIGSASRFGTMAAPLKAFLEQTSDLWLSGTLNDRPAGAFTSSASLHGGQEATLLQMLLPLLHHGMLVTGISYRTAALLRTRGGGSPYGAGHVSGQHGERPLDADEKTIAEALGARLARLALQLSGMPH